VSVVDDIEVVRAWRSPATDRALWIHGVTTQYRAEPAGELIIGLSVDRGYHLRRARTRTLVRPGQLVVLDPSAAHSGSPADRGPWEGRLLVLEPPGLDALVGSLDGVDDLRRLDFPQPTVARRWLAARFLALHRRSEQPASALEHESALHSFLDDLAHLAPAGNRRSSIRAHRDPAVRRACDHLRAHPARNVTLDELATVAGTTTFRLVRLFKQAFGLPPHAFQITQRIMLARRLIERGLPLVDVAEATGFVDQSHLHRHFHPRLGLTPGQYAQAIGAPARPRTPLPRDHRGRTST
jgi:AraC-like DNA-binding protein